MKAMNEGTHRKGLGSTRPWRHPVNREVVLPYNEVAAVAMMEMGINDYAQIAAAVGLTEKEVKRIDTAEDDMVRQLAIEGIPPGEHFRLIEHVRCPRCSGRINLAPCVACTQEHMAEHEHAC